MLDLKPCPFCGGTDLDVRPFDSGIICYGCGAWMPSAVSSDKAKTHTAIEGWNRRAPDPRIERAREALKRADIYLEQNEWSKERGVRALVVEALAALDKEEA